MKFLISFRKKPKFRWLLTWHHNTTSSSWWRDDIVWADTIEEAIEKFGRGIEIDEHTRYRRDQRPRLEIRVRQIPEDYETYFISDAVKVEPVTDQ